LMGRTIPSFRIAKAQETAEWRAFRKALPKRDKMAFDDMLSSARLFTSASSAAVRTSRFEGMVMALIFNHYRMLARSLETFTETDRQGDGGR